MASSERDTADAPAAPIAMRAYSNALDEIWRLRRAMAYEARVVEAHYEGYKTFPKSRRRVAEEQVERMRAMAAGGSESIYVGGTNENWIRHEMERLGGSQTLTRSQWEAERGIDPAGASDSPKTERGQ